MNGQSTITFLLSAFLAEDLDAFLADMNLDCETILQKTSLAPADVMRSADAFDLLLFLRSSEFVRHCH